MLIEKSKTKEDLVKKIKTLAKANYKQEEKEAKTGTVLGYEMMAKITLVDLVYDMNRNTCHKMNFIIKYTVFQRTIGITVRFFIVYFQLFMFTNGRYAK